MLKRALLSLVAAAVGLAVMIGVEILIAVRREYIPTEPALEIGGTFGEGSRQVTFVVLGDSTGAGVGAGVAERSFPFLLAQRLAEAEGVAVELIDLAESGARVEDVLNEQVDAAVAADPDLVLVAIGANDVTHFTGLDSVRENTGLFVKRLRDEGLPVVVAGAPDMRAPAFFEPLRSIVGWRGRAVTGAIEESAIEAGATVVPLADRTRAFFLSSPDEAYGTDLFHPGPAGYERWVQALFPEVAEALHAMVEASQ